MPKYTVYKNLDDGTREELLPGEVFVLRMQDFHAAQAVFDYSSSLQTTLELNEEFSFLTTKQISGLTMMIENAHRVATRWLETTKKKKVPDQP